MKELESGRRDLAGTSKKGVDASAPVVAVPAQVLNASTDRAAWLEARKKTITATDIAAIVGLHPYETARSVYMRKTGQMDEKEETESMYLGSKLEPLIAQIYAEKNGLEFGKDVIPTGFMTHPQNPRHGATPDFLIRPTDTLLETKWAGPNTARNFGEEGTDETPSHYLLQCQWQLHCSGKAKCVLTVLTAYGKVKSYTIERDDELIRRMVFQANKFLGEYIDADVPPPISGHDVDTKALNEKWEAQDGKVVAASYELEESIAALKEKTADAKNVASEVDRLKNVIREFMGDATIMESSEGKFSWKPNKASVKTNYQTCFEGLLNYSKIMLADNPELQQLFINEAIRLTDAATETKDGARVLRTPWRSERS